MFEMIYILIALVGSIGIGIYDLKTSDVPDNACYFMICAGVGLHFIESFLVGDYTLFFNTLIVGLLFFTFGAIMYYSKQWGGGDAAILIAIGVLTATLPSSPFPFALSFFVNLTIIGVFYSILYAMAIAKKNGADVLFFKSLKKEKEMLIKITGFAALISVLMAVYLSMHLILLIPPLMVLLLLFYYFIMSVDKSFRTIIPVSKLKIGDVVGEDIPRANVYFKQIRGLTKKDIARIKKYRKNVLVVDGIRYTPAFAIALIFTLVYGDIIALIFL